MNTDEPSEDSDVLSPDDDDDYVLPEEELSSENENPPPPEKRMKRFQKSKGRREKHPNILDANMRSNISTVTYGSDGNRLHPSVPSTSAAGTSTQSTESREPDNRHESTVAKKVSDYFQCKYDQNSKRDKTGICILCKKRNVDFSVKMKGSNTSGLHRHLKLHRNKEFESLFPKKIPVLQTPPTARIESFFRTTAATREEAEINTVPTSDLIEKETTKWVALKLLPFNFFDDKQTEDYFRLLNPSVKMPKRKKMKQLSSTHFQCLRVKVKNLIRENSSKLSFTLDGWTSSAGKSYYGITVHFIDNEWNLRSVVLDFVASEGKHTGRDIAQAFYKCVSEYGILDKVMGITVDNAAANSTCMEKLSDLIPGFDENNHFRCFAHIMNLAVQDMLKILKVEESGECLITGDEGHETDSEKEEENLIDEGDENDTTPLSKLRNLFKKIKHSEQFTRKLKMCCELTSCDYKTPVLDVVTRWNSSFNMIDCGIKMKNGLNHFCDTNAAFSQLRLFDKEWTFLQDAWKFLLPFKKFSTYLCGQKYATLPTVIVGFNLLLDKIEAIYTDYAARCDNPESNTFLAAIKASSEKMMKHYTKTNWIYCAVLILDPKHKKETFPLSRWGHEMMEQSVETFENIFKNNYYLANVSEVSDVYTDQPEDSEDEKDIFDLNALFEHPSHHLSRLNPDANEWRRELDAYYSEKRAMYNVEILKYWATNGNKFPCLQKMARDFVCIQAFHLNAYFQRLVCLLGSIEQD